MRRPDGDGLQQISATQMATVAAPEDESPFLRRYRVNLVVDNGESRGAPVIHVEYPTYAKLFGCVEHVSTLGALVADFNLVRGGALHRANGGYLVLDALEVLRQPYAWDGLKRARRTKQIAIESIGEKLSLIHTVSLEPESVPLDVKVVLIGEPRIYYALSSLDPEFRELFKVAVDFDDRIARNPESEAALARTMVGMIRDEGLLAFDRGAICRAVEQSARIASDSERLSLEISRVRDLLRESDHWARAANAEHVGRSHVERALAQQDFRADRLRQRIQQEICRGMLSISTKGREIGQVNGLAVSRLGDFAFGRPSRITDRVRLGAGELVDIEREVELSGPLHAKGVLILQAFLGQRYSAESPLSLWASLVFEQSYSGVDGDSASSAELYSLLSAIGRIPLSQGLTATGAVDQHGRVRAVGGVNEKVEGFFDVCRSTGLTGDQGVLIPAANMPHLMLERRVLEAVSDGKCSVYSVDSIDEGMACLTGLSAGERREDGSYPEDSVNGRVESRLRAFAERRQAYARRNERAREDA